MTSTDRLPLEKLMAVLTIIFFCLEELLVDVVEGRQWCELERLF
jgi:hypothetical protein